MQDGARLNPKRLIMGNQQPSPEQGKVQRLSRKGVGRKRLVPEVVAARKGDDIVCTGLKKSENTD